MTRRIIHRLPGGAVCIGSADGGHVYGEWLACACELSISEHTEGVGWFQDKGWCGWEHRLCRCCPDWQERPADTDSPTEPLTDTRRPAGRRASGTNWGSRGLR